MSNADDAKEHLTVIHDFMAGKQDREARRITRDLSARLDPITLTQALAAALPHVPKDPESGNHMVGVVFTADHVLVVASSGLTMIVCKVATINGARVTGDVLADSIILTPTMASQLMGFAGLTPKESWDPEVEVTVTGTGPEKIRIRATDRTGLFEGKSITLPAAEPAEELARAVHVLESMAAQNPRSTRTTVVPADRLKVFLDSAKKYGGEIEIEEITAALWRVSCGKYFYGLATNPVAPTDEKEKMLTADTRRQTRLQWSDDLTGVGQELVKGFR
ncbi:hypothetical protein GCM10009700_31950 [Brevibacterium sanguinis]|uniref:hypothetical protein n=1 Tax=Brevibacterium sanguinis TaxID=232444 RepID=UPI0031DB20AF